MAIKHYAQSDVLTDFSEISNMIFAVVFNVEMVMKLIAL